MQSFPRRVVCLCVPAFLLLVSCGGGGGGDGSGGSDGGDDGGGPLTTGADLQDHMPVYSEPGTDLIDVYITIRPEDNPESEEDTDCPFIDPNDGIGTTLDDVDQDILKNDGCKAEVNLILEITDLPGSGGDANAELRLRGASTRRTEQKSYRIKLDSKDAQDLWRGQRVLNLNKHPYDLSRLRNKLCFDLLSQIPHITSLRTQFVRLYVDQADGRGFVDYGLFTHVERVDDYFLEAHRLDPDATIYKAEFFEFGRHPDSLKLKSDPTYDEDAFEEILEIKEGKDHAPLLAMLDELNDGGTDFEEVFATYFNRPNYLTWLACSILFDNVDTNSQNFFLYRPDGTSTFYFLPWDYDGAFDFYGQPVQAQVEQLGRWQRSIANWWAATLHLRFLKQPGALAELTAKMTEIRDQYASASQVQTLIDSYTPTVRPQVAKSPDLNQLPVLDASSTQTKLAEFDAECARLAALVAAKHQQFLDTVERPMPVFMSDNVVGADVLFRWDESFDLQGDGLTYDFQLATSPEFDAPSIVTESLGLVDTVTYSYPVASLAPGTYYYRVIVRDDKNPSENWQIAFDSYWDEQADKVHFGVRRMVVEASP
ncbi:MAG: CotH kinase family protein [Planctomycetota bacterium]